MTDFLDQADIDALLEAAGPEEETSSEPAVEIFSSRRTDLHDVDVRTFDFKRPERVSKDQMSALQTLHESFARNFGASLSGFLRTIIEVKIGSCEQMTYSEFISALPNPTSFNLLTASPLEGQVCLEVSPLIIYPIVDRLLGGTNEELFIPQRPLTMIEGRLINKILERAIDSLQEAWDGIRTLEFEISGGESNPHLVQIVPPNEVVVVVGFEIKMASRAGTMNLCIPYAVIEPLMEELAAQSWFSSARLRGSEKTKRQIERELGGASLEVRGTLARTTITMADLMNLAEGDVILTTKPAVEPVLLEVEGEDKFTAHVGQHRGNRALRIDGPLADA